MTPPTSQVRAEKNIRPPAPSGPQSRRLPLRILFVHNDTREVGRCVHELERSNFKVSADVVRAREELLLRLKSKFYDVVLAAYPPPEWQGSHALEILHGMDRQIPFIFLTETVQLETVAEVITRGAADCVAMDHVGHLPIAIRRALSENNLREQRDQAEKQLRHSEARYRALVGNLTYGICRCDGKGKFLDVNEALVAMFGYSSREKLLAANHAANVFCDPRKRKQLLGQAAEQDGPDPLEVEWKRMDGTLLKARLSGREVGSEGDAETYEVIVEDVTQQRRLEEHLRQQAAKDPLTGLANYRHLVEVVDAEIKRSGRTKREFALLFLDLDGLKQVNDRYGHLVGSQALCRLADVLSLCSRSIDTAARFGGDEFALVLPETGRTPANIVARRIADNYANDGAEPKLSVSIGVAIYPKDGNEIESLLGAADAALYSMKAKRNSAEPAAGKKTAKPGSQAAARSTPRPVNR